MAWQFKRYDIDVEPLDPDYLYVRVPSGDGAHVSAEEAVNREAVNAERIRLLEVQLKETRNNALEEVLKGLRSEDDSQQLRAIIASVEAMLK